MYEPVVTSQKLIPSCAVVATSVRPSGVSATPITCVTPIRAPGGSSSGEDAGGAG